MEVKQNLSWEGVPVLSWGVSLPDGPERCRRLNRYLKKTEQVWRERWEKRLYPAACAALGEGVLFRSWSGILTGIITCQDKRLYSMKLEAEEVRGDGRPCLVCWGLLWDVREDAPGNVENLLQPGKDWENRVLERIFREGTARQRENLWFPDADWQEKAKKALKTCTPWADEKAVFWSFPQGFMADPADGTPVFSVEREVLG